MQRGLLPQKIQRVAELAEGSRLAAINRLRSKIEQVGMRVSAVAFIGDTITIVSPDARHGAV